jgi:RNA polymerase sigma factor (sigma-70 family)
VDFQIDAVWREVKKGDSWAWTRLVEKYAGLVYGVARNTGLDVADAEDCAQFTWLALYKQRHRIRDAAAIPAWLSRTARRRAVRMAQTLHRETPLDSAPEPKAPDTEVDQDTIRSDVRAALPQAMEQMDPRCRKLLLALFLSDQESTYRELASELGVDPNTIGPMRSRCLKRLEKILKKMGYTLH